MMKVLSSLTISKIIIVGAFGVVLAISGCSSDRSYKKSGSHSSKSAGATKQGYSPYGGTKKPTRVLIGKPYTIKGKRYYPKSDPTYNKVGLASWYGPGFHGRKTANGERYNQNAMTAAHKTLPLPSFVRVTRLDTGQSIKVRVNDRGPFADGRIIDLSKAAAKKLGTIKHGVAKVRVEYLAQETERYIAGLGLKTPKGWKKGLSGKRYASPAKRQHVKKIKHPVQKVATKKALSMDKIIENAYITDSKKSSSSIKTVSRTRKQAMNDRDFSNMLGSINLSPSAKKIAPSLKVSLD